MDVTAKQIIAKRRASANVIAKERRKSKRLENLNQKRNIKVETEKKVIKPKPRVDRELEAWRKKRELEKKTKLTNKKPVFQNCIAVKHTGGTPFRDNFSLPFKSKAIMNKFLFNAKPEKPIKEAQHNFIPKRILRSNKENVTPPFNHLDNVTRRIKSGLEPPIAGPSGLKNVKKNNLKKIETSTKPEPKKLPLSKNVTKLVKDENIKKDTNKKRVTRSMAKLNKRPEVYKEPTEADKQKDKLKTETSRLLLLAVEWDDKKQSITNQEHIDEIDSVIGLTRLLIRSKFKQFESLINEFDVQKDKKRILVEDLNGFWDMIYIQVNQLDSKYKNLEILIKNN